MKQTPIFKRVHFFLVLGGLLAGTIVFQGVFSREAPELKATSLSQSKGQDGTKEGQAETEIGRSDSSSTHSQKESSDKKMKDGVAAPEKVPSKNSEGSTPPASVDLPTLSILKGCGKNSGRDQSEPCKKQTKELNANGKPNDKKQISGHTVHPPPSPLPHSTLKITSLSPSESPAGTEIQILGSGFTTSLEGISGTKVKNAILAPGNYVVIQDEVVPQPLLSPDGVTLTARVDLLTSKLVKKCEEKFSKEKPEPCRVQIKVINAYGKSSNRKGFLITGSSVQPPPPPSHGSAPTVSIIWPAKGRGWAPDTNMHIKINVANYSDPVTYGGLLFNLVRAGSVVQTFSYDDVSFDIDMIDMPKNSQPSGAWAVPSSLPAGNDYTLEAYFANSPKKKTVSDPFSILGSTVTINGQVVDAFTGAPIQAELLGSPEMQETDASGNFSITKPNSVFWDYGIWASAACHMANPSLSPWLDTGDQYYFDNANNIIGDNAFGLALTNEMFIAPEAVFVPITGPSVNITMREWPAVDISITSDIPVTFRFSYGSIEGGGGPSFYSASWPLLTSYIPLDQDTTVTLTAEDGTTYTSPVLHLPRNHGCGPVKLTFTGGKFTWEP